MNDVIQNFINIIFGSILVSSFLIVVVANSLRLVNNKKYSIIGIILIISCITIMTIAEIAMPNILWIKPIQLSIMSISAAKSFIYHMIQTGTL